MDSQEEGGGGRRKPPGKLNEWLGGRWRRRGENPQENSMDGWEGSGGEEEKTPRKTLWMTGRKVEGITPRKT